MNCKNCGNKIEDGKLYCDFCGMSVQVVPDYNAFDDDALASLLKEQPEEHPVAKETDAMHEKNKKSTTTKKHAKKKRSRKIIILITLLCILACVSLGAVIYFHSGKYYYSMGEAKDKSKDYETAILYYEQAEVTYPVKARVKIGADYLLLEEYEKAEEILLEAISLDSDNTEAYRTLLRVYDQTEDYEAMRDLKEDVTSERILKLFQNYVTDTVTYSEDGGNYKDDILLKLSAPSGYTIYYTLDGTAPTALSGQKYKNPIELTDGTTTVKSICVNTDGKESSVVSKTYKITYASPDYPEVTPSSGTYHTQTYITMTAKDGEHIYYTWDGTVPTSDSAEYVEPIAIPEGNQILSVIVVNEHGMSSNVLKMNYQYLP